jgi:fumarylacetoacetase
MAAQCWLHVDEDSPFSIENIPFGVVSHHSAWTGPRIAVAIGDFVILLHELAEGGALAQCLEILPHVAFLDRPTLNDFASLGQSLHQAFRIYLRALLLAETPYPDLLRDNASLQSRAIYSRKNCVSLLPMQICDYTDFYAGLNHAYNVGVLFRGPDNALQPNYTHLPVGYHGRASTVRPSGYPIRRPWGQILPQPSSSAPIHTPCRKLDIELEMGAFVCTENGSDGRPISIAEAPSHIFGYVLMNDWSARDIQAWEYVPLGPFNSKNFATTISPWVVLAGALEPFHCETLIKRPSDVSVLPYLDEGSRASLHDIQLTVTLTPSVTKDANSNAPNPIVVSQTNSANLLYSFPQMLAHHTVTGCEMNTGDLLGSGTISGSKTDVGSFLELTKNGKEPVTLSPASDTDEAVQRTFLEDGDEVNLTGMAGKRGAYVGFGDCKGVILPAYALN